jgi:hypothetical protein
MTKMLVLLTHAVHKEDVLLTLSIVMIRMLVLKMPVTKLLDVLMSRSTVTIITNVPLTVAVL